MLLRVLAALAVVVAAIWWLQRRLQQGRGGRAKAISVVSRQGVGAKASVAVVDVDGRRFLLGVTDHAVTVLHSGDAPAEAFAHELAAQAAGPGAAPSAADRPSAARPIAAQSGTVQPAAGRPAAQPDPALVRPAALDAAPLTASVVLARLRSPETWRRALANLRP